MRWVVMIVGALAVLIGIVWTLQGLNIIQGNLMSGNTTFAVVGPILAAAGLILLLMIGARGRRVKV
ncbi:MAG TPA: hypothetical protein VF792_09485 [Ktedonobacterales bacterium]